MCKLDFLFLFSISSHPILELFGAPVSLPRILPPPFVFPTPLFFCCLAEDDNKYIFWASSCAIRIKAPTLPAVTIDEDTAWVDTATDFNGGAFQVR